MMLNLWNTISYIGTTNISSDSSRRNVIITNRLVTISFLLNFLLFALNVSRSGWTFMSLAMLIGNLTAYPAILLLNHYGKSTVSRLILSFMFSLYPFVTSLRSKIVNPDTIAETMYFSPRLFIMITSIIPLLLFSNREWKYLILALSASFIPMIGFDLIHDFFGVGYYQMGFDSRGYSIFIYISVTGYLMFLSATYFFKSINEKYERDNVNLIDSLKKKNEEIELQAGEIKMINQNLSAVLDNRTKQLLDQAMKFQRFVYKNSHELRAPLTKVMSTITLLKTATDPDQKAELLALLDESCSKLDQIIHEINETLSSEPAAGA